MKEYTEWLENIDGYSGETVIARAMAGHLEQGTFGSRIPKGVEPPQPWMRRLSNAMADICDKSPPKCKYIRAMQLHYLIGPKKAQEILGRPARTMRRWRLRGEDILRRELKANT